MDIDSLKNAAENNSINNLFYSTLLDSIKDGIWVTDRDDTIFYVNKAMENIAGVTKENIIGNNVLKDFSDETIKEFNNFYLKVKNELNPTTYKAKVKTPSGNNTFQTGWLIPVIDNNKFNGIICTIKDVTEQIKIEKALKDSQTILAQAERLANVGSWDWNIDNGISYWSDNLYQIHGISKEDGIPDFEEYKKMLTPPDQETLANKLEAAAAGTEEYNVTYQIKKRNTDSLCHLHSIGNLIISENNEKHLRGVTLDITDKVIAQSEIEIKINELEKFNKFMVGREERMIELKNEVNELCELINIPKKYLSPEQKKDFNLK